MKLISVQSRGNRLVRIKQRKPFFYTYGLIISNPFCDKDGWLSIVDNQKHNSQDQALQAAETWLKGATT